MCTILGFIAYTVKINITGIVGRYDILIMSFAQLAANSFYQASANSSYRTVDELAERIEIAGVS